MNAQPNASSESWTFTLENCVATPKWKWRFPQSRKLLLVHHFDLPIDHLAGKSVDRHMHPVVLLPFHDETILKGCSIWRITPGLGNDIDTILSDHVRRRFLRANRSLLCFSDESR